MKQTLMYILISILVNFDVYGQQTKNKVVEFNPVKINSVHIFPNEIGIPAAMIVVENRSKETIIAMDAEIKCYDAMGRKATFLYTNTNQEIVTFKSFISPGDAVPMKISFDLNERVQFIRVKIIKVRFENGRIIKIKNPISSSSTGI